MDLPETYSKIRESIVAFIPKVFPANADGSPPDIPPIFGTGYVIHEGGVIATNDHVVRGFHKCPRLPGESEDSWPVYAMLLHRIEEGVVQVPLEVLGVGTIQTFEPSGAYYGPPKPDLAFVHVKARGLTPVKVLDEIEIREGMSVATAGFPMGTDLLTAPGWLHQVTPTLQQGIISAVQPFVSPRPHGFSTNIMVQGGASGSPVFLPDTGAVIGTIYASLKEPSVVWGRRENNDGREEPIGIVRLPTTYSQAVPAHYLSDFLSSLPKHKEFLPPDDAKTLAEMMADATLVNRFSKDTPYAPVYEGTQAVSGVHGKEPKK